MFGMSSRLISFQFKTNIPIYRNQSIWIPEHLTGAYMMVIFNQNESKTQQIVLLIFGFNVCFLIYQQGVNRELQACQSLKSSIFVKIADQKISRHFQEFCPGYFCALSLLKSYFARFSQTHHVHFSLGTPLDSVLAIASEFKLLWIYPGPDWLYVMRCAILYHFYNLKNMKNTNGGVFSSKVAGWRLQFY